MQRHEHTTETQKGEIGALEKEIKNLRGTMQQKDSIFSEQQKQIDCLKETLHKKQTENDAKIQQQSAAIETTKREIQQLK